MVSFVPIAITQSGEKIAEAFHFFFRHLQTNEHAADIAALATIMKQANVPIGCEAIEKAHQRAGSFGKFKAIQQFIVCQRTLATGQMPDVYLG